MQFLCVLQGVKLSSCMKSVGALHYRGRVGKAKTFRNSKNNNRETYRPLGNLASDLVPPVCFALGINVLRHGTTCIALRRFSLTPPPPSVFQVCVASQKMLRGKQGRLKARRELLRQCAAVEVSSFVPCTSFFLLLAG